MHFQVVADIFELHPELIVHPVNCQGLCRDTFSKNLKKSWPEYFREYSRSCQRKKLVPAEPVTLDLGTMLGTRYVVTLPIRGKWNEPLTPDVMKPAMAKVLEKIEELKVTSVAMPLLSGTPDGWQQNQFVKFFGSEKQSSLSHVYFTQSE